MTHRLCCYSVPGMIYNQVTTSLLLFHVRNPLQVQQIDALFQVESESESESTGISNHFSLYCIWFSTFRATVSHYNCPIVFPFVTRHEVVSTTPSRVEISKSLLVHGKSLSTNNKMATRTNTTTESGTGGKFTTTTVHCSHKTACLSFANKCRDFSP